MVGKNDTSESSLSSEDSVLQKARQCMVTGEEGDETHLPALDSLEDDGHLGDGHEPRDIGPAERSTDERTDSPRGSLRLVDGRVLLDVRSVVAELLSHILLTSTELGGVDGDEESLDSTSLGLPTERIRASQRMDGGRGREGMSAPDNLLRDVAVLVDVELHPLGLSRYSSIDNLVERARGESRNHLGSELINQRCPIGESQDGTHLDDTGLSSCPGQVLLSVRVSELSKSGCGDVDRCGEESAGSVFRPSGSRSYELTERGLHQIFVSISYLRVRGTVTHVLAEHGRLVVDVGHVAQDPGTEPDPLVSV